MKAVANTQTNLADFGVVFLATKRTTNVLAWTSTKALKAFCKQNSVF
jgi:hypothetical protein